MKGLRSKSACYGHRPGWLSIYADTEASLARRHHSGRELYTWPSSSRMLSSPTMSPGAGCTCSLPTVIRGCATPPGPEAFFFGRLGAVARLGSGVVFEGALPPPDGSCLAATDRFALTCVARVEMRSSRPQ